jgi:hypothetical protein
MDSSKVTFMASPICHGSVIPERASPVTRVIAIA